LERIEARDYLTVLLFFIMLPRRRSFVQLGAREMRDCAARSMVMARAISFDVFRPLPFRARFSTSRPSSSLAILIRLLFELAARGHHVARSRWIDGCLYATWCRITADRRRGSAWILFRYIAVGNGSAHSDALPRDRLHRFSSAFLLAFLLVARIASFTSSSPPRQRCSGSDRALPLVIFRRWRFSYSGQLAFRWRWG